MHTFFTNEQAAYLRGFIDGYTSDEDHKIPGLVYCAFRNDAVPIFQHCSGTTGLVERGIFVLDDADQVESLCPELRDIKVLCKNKAGSFDLVEKKRRITLRMLLNHTARFGYAFEDERLAAYGRPVGIDDFSGERADLFDRPLVNQPGETFQYGTSLDWVGIMIERTLGVVLEDYFQEQILRPLEIRSVSFFPSRETVSSLARMHQRSNTGKIWETDHIFRRPLILGQRGSKQDIFCAGGHGCFGKPAEFMRIISLLLNEGTDALTGTQLLRPETVKEMFRDQIPDLPRFSNSEFSMAKPYLANSLPLTPMPNDHTEGWGLSFSISHFPAPTGRPAGTGSWEGLANLYWFADPVNKIGAIIATQILPYGDPYVLDCFDRTETYLYKTLRENDAASKGHRGNGTVINGHL